jgi:hypothetical protein
MDQTKLYNEFITTLSEKYKSLAIENIMLTTQIKLLTEELDRTKKELEGLRNSSSQSQ